MKDDPRTTEEKLQDDQVQQTIQDDTFSTLTPEEKKQSIARAKLRKEASVRRGHGTCFKRKVFN
jgi:hypothetical protein